MKMKKKSILALVGAILLLCTLSVSVFAARYTDYQDNTSDPTFRVRASLQGDVFSDANFFRRVFATTRFDATAVSPTYTQLDLTVMIRGTKLDDVPYVEAFDVPIGSYITTNDVYLDRNDNVFYLTGEHTAGVFGSTISFNPPGTHIQADSPD